MNSGIFPARSIALGGVFLFALVMNPAFPSSVNAGQTNHVTTTNQTLGGFELEMTNAYQRVLKIVNKPVRAFAKTPGLQASIFSPGWFHEGASKPDFNTVDIRQSQEFPYASKKYVTSDLTPKVVFLGQDLEFNAMTKIFYTNRSLPKHKLTEAEMVEINQLYRVIGKCEQAILRIQNPVLDKASDVQPVNEEVVPGQPLAAIRSMPQEKRILYGGIAVGVLIVLVLISRVLRNKARTG